MSRISRDIFTQLDLNGPYLRIDSQPQDITKESVFGNSAPGRESRYTATFTVVVSTYFMTGDEADIVTTPTTYNVTVASKTSSHPYFGQGSGNGYYITGGIYHEVTESPNLQFVKGKTYVFTQNDPSSTPHPMYFSAVESAYGGDSRYETGVTYTLDGVNVSYTAYVSGFAAATQRSVSITVDASAPSTLYYACAVHQYMGNAVTVNDTSDDVIEEDAIPPTVDNSGFVAYQWYEQRGDSQDLATDILLRDGIDDITGVNTPTLSITNLQSPEDNQREFYCLLDYVPSQYETGNAVNEIFTSNTVTLTVLPHIIIDDQPDDITGYINEDVPLSLTARLSDTFFADDLTYQWYEVREGFELIPDLLRDGSYIDNRLSLSIESETVIENVIREDEFLERVPYTKQGSRRLSKQVGIPTEAVEVTLKVAGGQGGGGGNESGTWTGGTGGVGRYAEFRFNEEQINLIRNKGSVTNVIINSGRAGNDGPSNTSDPTAIGNGGACQVNQVTDAGVFGGSAGDGGFAGPNGTSGAGGGGGGCSTFQIEVYTETVINSFDPDDGTPQTDTFKGFDLRNIAIAGGGGGGGGASEGASGAAGGTGDGFTTFVETSEESEIKQATPVNFNPTCTETNDTINIDYGFYTKTANAKSDLVGASPDRLVIIWDGDVVFDRPRATTNVLNDSKGYYIEVGTTKYYASAHRSSLLGWCDDNSCGTCTRLATEAQDPDNIDINRQTGGYANAFDIIRVVTSDAISINSIPIDFGGNGQDKVTGDGGGGGGGGASAISPTDGGNAGKDPVPAANASITVISSGNGSILGTRYIRMVPVAGGDSITFDLGNLGTREITIPAGSTWDIVSNIDDGLSSENIALLPDLGRSVGLDVFADGRGDFDDLVVTFSDGTFKNVSRTIFNDGEFLGRSIIQYTAPARSINGIVATGGEGGQSAYMTSYMDKIDEGTHTGEGFSEVYIRTQRPYDILTQEQNPALIVQNRSYSGTTTNSLTIRADYSFSTKYLCRIRSTIASPIKVLDSRHTQVVVLDATRNAITVEEIGTDGFARISAVDLDNADLFLRPSTESGSNKTEYYSFYSPVNLDVDLKLFGGKGTNFNGNAGGNGGFGYMRLRMQANTEYVIAGLDEFNNTPFLFKKGNLIATVGAGGHAGRNGRGGNGGGTLQGGERPPSGGAGGSRTTSLGTNGVVGSASAVEAISPDIKADGDNGGQTLKCSKGSYWRDQGLSPCSDIAGNTQFRLADGTIVTNTNTLSRGFKAGYNIFNTAGEGGKTGNSNRESDGGSGAAGGQGSTTGYGGGGGAGFISESPELFMRYSYEADEDGVTSGSRSGYNNGEPYVQISRVDVRTDLLEEFIEYPNDIVIGVDDIDIVDTDVFEPLPIVSVPDPAREPNPSVSITNPTFPRGTGTIIDVDEGSDVVFSVETIDIPPFSRIYWAIDFNGSNSDDFVATTGHFDTIFADDGTSKCLGTFTVSVVADTTTEFINAAEYFGVTLYSNSDRTIIVASTPSSSSFNIVDTSRTPPSATITPATLPNRGSTPVTLYEGQTKTFNVITNDIPLFPAVAPLGNLTLHWEVDPRSNCTFADFVQPSGYVNVSVADPSTSVTGTGSFTIQTFEDFLTEEEDATSAQFNINLYYDDSANLGLSTHLFRGRDSRENIRINDTSRDPVYILLTPATVLNENVYQLRGSLGGDYDLDLGDPRTFTLATEWVTNGSTFYWQIVSGSNNTTSFTAITSGDFVAASSTFTIAASTTPGTSIPGSGTFTVRTVPDGNIEGTENFTVQVHKTTDSFGNAITYPNASSLVQHSPLTVFDTARPYYHLIPSVIAMNENVVVIGGSNFGAGNFDLDVGASQTITLTTNYIASGTTFFYEVRDSANAVATGQFAVPSNTFTVSGDFYTSTGTFTLTTVPDGILEGTQNYTVRVYQGTSNSDPEVTTGDTVNPGAVTYPLQITVTDTAFPKYQLTPTSVSMTENGATLIVGDTETFTFKTEYVTPGSTFFYQIIDDGTSLEATADFTASSGTFLIATGGANNFFNATSTFSITTDPDGVLEGTEGFTINIYEGSNNSGTLVETSTISVDDTAFPIYRVTKTGTVNDFAETINELPPTNSVTLDVYVRYPVSNSSPYPPLEGADVFWKVFKSDGTTVADAADFDGAINGSFTANTGGTDEVLFSSAITLTAADDFATDSADPEVFIVKLSPDNTFPDLSSVIVAENFTLSINDTSQDPIYTISGSSSINEVDTSAPPYSLISEVYTLTTTNVLTSDTLLYKIVKSDLTDATADFNDDGFISSDSVSGEWQLQAGSSRNKATWKLRLQPTDDRVTDGDKDFIIQTYNGSYSDTNRTNFPFTVVDNSQTPTFSISGSTPITEIGPTAQTYTLTTTNVDTFEVIYYEIDGIADGTDPFDTDVSGTWTNDSGNRFPSASWEITVTPKDDFNTQGDKNYTIRTSRGGFVSNGFAEVASFAFTVTDDSNTRAYSLEVDDDALNEGDTANFTLTTSNVITTDTIRYEIVDSDGFSVNDIINNRRPPQAADTGDMKLQSGSTRASGTWKISVIAEEDETTENEVVTYTMNVYNDTVDSSTVVTTKDFTITDTSTDHPPSYTLTSNKTNNIINEQSNKRITYTLKSFSDTGGTDGKGGKITDGDTFTRYWRLINSDDNLSNNNNVSPYRGSVTMTVNGRANDENGDSQPFAEGTFRVDAVRDFKDEVDPGQYNKDTNQYDIEYFNIEIFYTQDDRDRKDDEIAYFSDALGIQDSSIEYRYFGTDDGAIITNYAVDEGKSMTAYVYLSDPADTEVKFEVTSPINLDLPDNYVEGDGSDFDASSKQQIPSDGVLTQTVKSVEYTSASQTFTKSRATITLAALNDGETEVPDVRNDAGELVGRQRCEIAAYINNKRVIYDDLTLREYWAIDINDVSRNPYTGCPDEDQYFSADDEDRGSCPVIEAGSIGTVKINMWKTNGEDDNSSRIAFPHRIYYHEPPDNSLATYTKGTGPNEYYKSGTVGYVMWARKTPATIVPPCGHLLATPTSSITDPTRYNYGIGGTGFDFPYAGPTSPGERRYWFPPGLIKSDTGFPNYTNAYLDNTELLRGELVPLWYCYKSQRIDPTPALPGDVRRYDEIFSTNRADIMEMADRDVPWALHDDGSTPVAFIFSTDRGVISNIRVKNTQSFENDDGYPPNSCRIGYWYQSPDE